MLYLKLHAVNPSFGVGIGRLVADDHVIGLGVGEGNGIAQQHGVVAVFFVKALKAQAITTGRSVLYARSGMKTPDVAQGFPLGLRLL